MPTKRARKRPKPITLEAGKFYKARDGSEWCCFKVDLDKPAHCQACCIKVEGKRVEYFYLDGRYDGEGKREHTLIEEVLPPHQQVLGHKNHLKALMLDSLDTCLKQITEDPKFAKLVPVLFDAALVFKFEGSSNDVRTHLAYDFEQRLALSEDDYG